jgi:hypothetical protein
MISTKRTSGWEYTLTYPIDSTIYVEPTPPSANVATTYYDGTLVSISPGTVRTQSMYQNFGDTAYCSRGVVHTISVAGLKPTTVHTVKIGDTTDSITAKPILTSGTGVGSYTATFTSDAHGKATFDMVVDNLVTDTIDSIQSPLSRNKVPSTLFVKAASADNSSLVSLALQFDTGLRNASISTTIKSTTSNSATSMTTITSDEDAGTFRSASPSISGSGVGGSGPIITIGDRSF